MGLVRGDLQHAVGGGVEDRLAAGDMLDAEVVDHRHAGGMRVAERAGQAGARDQRAGDLRRDRRVGAREIVPLPGHRHAGELPVAGGRVLAAGDLGGRGPGAARRGQARRRGRRRRGSPTPRPRAAMVGTWSGPERPLSARPSAQARAMWPSVLAPSSPKAAASGAPPQPTESITMRTARGIRPSRSWISGVSAGGVSAMV